MLYVTYFHEEIMKNSADPIWTNTNELNDCLDSTPTTLLTMSDNPLQNEYVVLENGNKDLKNNNSKNKDNFEDMLYYVCNLCPFLCTKKAKITEHLENAHKNKIVRNLPQFKCPACTNIFFHKLSLRSHLIHDHGVGNSDLNQIVQAVVYYANNKTKETKKAPIVEKKVEDFKLNLEKTIHKISVKGENSKKSDTSNKDTITKFIESKKYHRCKHQACKVQFQDVNNLNFHLNCHIDETFKCSVCGEIFKFWKSLASHLWRAHKVDMELYSCDKCEYKSISLYKLNNIHKLIHSDVKAFICTICKKGFKNVKQLSNHKSTHKKVDRGEIFCKFCLKKFNDSRQLRIHNDVVHEKKKPFLCNYCGYKGSSRSSLKMHIRQHTGEKPFACDSCSYTTSDHNSLRRHKLRHTGQKPYKCSYCSYACIQSSTYKVHLKSKHPGLEKDLMFTCQECQFRSVNRDIYITHLVTVHKLKPSLDYEKNTDFTCKNCSIICSTNDEFLTHLCNVHTSNTQKEQIDLIQLTEGV